MIRGKTERGKGIAVDSPKKLEGGAQSFIVSLFSRTDDTVFVLSAIAKPPYGLGKHIFWIRAREVGTGVWGQTLWVEVYDQEGGLFVSGEISPSSLWLCPNTAYEIEVAPETLRTESISLTMQAKSPATRIEVRKPELKWKKESPFDSPIFWMAFLGLGMLGMFLLRTVGS